VGMCVCAQGSWGASLAARPSLTQTRIGLSIYLHTISTQTRIGLSIYLHTMSTQTRIGLSIYLSNMSPTKPLHGMDTHSFVDVRFFALQYESQQQQLQR
jgi:hypothetical protein